VAIIPGAARGKKGKKIILACSQGGVEIGKTTIPGGKKSRDTVHGVHTRGKPHHFEKRGKRNNHKRWSRVEQRSIRSEGVNKW